MFDRAFRDFVKDEPSYRNFRLENLQQMPRDTLSLTVFISGEVQDIGLFELLFQLPNDFAFPFGGDVQRRKVVFHVDGESGPRFLFILRRDIRSGLREIADVPDTRLNDKTFRKKPLNRPRFCR